MRQLRIVLIVGWCASLLSLMDLVEPTWAWSEKPSAVPVAKPAVDQVVLRSGARLRGLVVDRDKAGGLTVLVRAAWLSSAQPKVAVEQTRATADEQLRATEQLVRRLKVELDRRKELDQPQLLFFLKQELERAEQQLAQPEPAEPEFVWFDLRAAQVEKLLPAGSEARFVAAWAWSERLDNVESRELAELQRELKGRSVSATSWPLPLIERLPPRLQDDREWAARMAIVEHALVSPVEFQGTGESIVRTDSSAKQNAPEIGTLVVQLLRQQVQAQLKDLLGEASPKPATPAKDAALQMAIDATQTAERRGFRVTRVQSSGELRQTSVTTQFVVRMPSGAWETIWQNVEQADATKPRPDIEDRIKDDPRIKSVVSLLQTAGLAAEQPLQQALRFGAATMSAQQAADRTFFTFRDSMLRTLAGPPLRTW